MSEKIVELKRFNQLTSSELNNLDTEYRRNNTSNISPSIEDLEEFYKNRKMEGASNSTQLLLG